MIEENPYESPKPLEKPRDEQNKQCWLLRIGWVFEAFFVCFGAMSFGRPYLVYISTFETRKFTADDMLNDQNTKVLFWSISLIFFGLGLGFFLTSYLFNLTARKIATKSDMISQSDE